MTTLQGWIVVLICNFALISGTPVSQNVVKSENDIQQNKKSETIFNYFAKCSYTEGVSGLISCAGARALKVIQQAARTKSLELLPGVVLTSEHSLTEEEGKSIVDRPLSSNPQQKAEKILELILDATGKFLSGRSLKVNIPEINFDKISRALEEARGKKKKGGMNNIIYILGAKLVLLKGLALAVLGLMSIKALVVAKVAFVLAVILGVQSLFGGNFNLKNIGGSPYSNGIHGWATSGAGSGGIGPSYGVPNSPGWTTNQIGGGGGGWNPQYPYARSISSVKDEESESRSIAHGLAYSNQKS